MVFLLKQSKEHMKVQMLLSAVQMAGTYRDANVISIVTMAVSFGGANVVLYCNNCSKI